MKHLFSTLFIFTLLTSLFTIASAASPPAPVPQTGQTTCYNESGATIACSGTGQDGELKTGVAWPNPRFTDNGNGTVTDNLTGLMWSKDANAPGPKACGPATNTTWQGAMTYADCLNSNNYLGYKEWRVPSIRELGGLVDKSRLNPALPAGHPFTSVQTGGYWSSTTDAYGGSGWFVNMGLGEVDNDGKGYSGYYVWPVRSVQSSAPAPTPATGQTRVFSWRDDGALKPGVAWPTPRFTDNSNGTVTDNLTGLIWLKNANCFGTRVWDNALATSNTLANGACGLTDGSKPGDWHLPNYNELWSLLDYGHDSPALPVGHPFTSVQTYFGYWSGTTYSYSTDFAWYMYSVGYVLGSSKSKSFYVWPVRSGSVPTTFTLTTAKTGTGSGAITSNPTGISCGTTCSAIYTSGTSVTLTATPATGSTFSGWSGACSGTGTCTITMDAAKSVTATFNLAPTASIIWRHQTDGTIYGMSTNGSNITSGAQFWQAADQAWTIVGQGDFDGDGVRDLVWQNSITGEVYLMLMSSPTAVKSGAVIYTEPNTNWKIVATGDINGDGKTDLIWWNKSTGQVYAMMLNGTTITGAGLIYNEPNTNWKIVAAADFNGNGIAELLWWNSTTGQTAIGQTNGTSASTANLIWTEPDTNWRIVGAGDLDGDGKADIIWHNRTTGQVSAMQTNGTTVTKVVAMYTEPDTNWEIVSVGNYNGDNKAELLWWNQQTGQVYLMPMNGLSVAGGSLLYTEPDTTWRIQGETEWRDNLYGRGVTTTTK